MNGWPVLWFRCRVLPSLQGWSIATIWAMNTPDGVRLLTVAGSGSDARTLDASFHPGRWVTREHQWTDKVSEAYQPEVEDPEVGDPRRPHI